MSRSKSVGPQMLRSSLILAGMLATFSGAVQADLYKCLNPTTGTQYLAKPIKGHDCILLSAAKPPAEDLQIPRPPRMPSWLERSNESALSDAISRAEEAQAAAGAAEEAADALRTDIEQAETRTRNNFYLGIFVLVAVGSVVYLVKRTKGQAMHQHQKFGLATIIGSVLASVIAVVLSDGWVTRLDLMQNLMSYLSIQFEFNGDYYDIPAKMIVLACLCAASYGLTTYLGITPVVGASNSNNPINQALQQKPKDPP